MGCILDELEEKLMIRVLEYLYSERHWVCLKSLLNPQMLVIISLNIYNNKIYLVILYQ